MAQRFWSYSRRVFETVLRKYSFEDTTKKTAKRSSQIDGFFYAGCLTVRSIELNSLPSWLKNDASKRASCRRLNHGGETSEIKVVGVSGALRGRVVVLRCHNGFGTALQRTQFLAQRRALHAQPPAGGAGMVAKASVAQRRVEARICRQADDAATERIAGSKARPNSNSKGHGFLTGRLRHAIAGEVRNTFFPVPYFFDCKILRKHR